MLKNSTADVVRNSKAPDGSLVVDGAMDLKNLFLFALSQWIGLIVSFIGAFAIAFFYFGTVAETPKSIAAIELDLGQFGINWFLSPEFAEELRNEMLFEGVADGDPSTVAAQIADTVKLQNLGRNIWRLSYSHTDSDIARLVVQKALLLAEKTYLNKFNNKVLEDQAYLLSVYRRLASSFLQRYVSSSELVPSDQAKVNTEQVLEKLSELEQRVAHAMRDMTFEIAPTTVRDIERSAFPIRAVSTIDVNKAKAQNAANFAVFYAILAMVAYALFALSRARIREWQVVASQHQRR